EAMAWNGYEMRSYLDVAYHGEISKRRQLELIQAYAACVTYIDRQIGRLLAQVDWETTVVVLWSDHGWHLGEHSAWGKMTNYEVATRVPLLIAAPRVKPGRTRMIAELVDLYPTLCDLVGIARPEHLEGESLLEANEVALSQYSRFGDELMGYALRTDRYRYVEWWNQENGVVVDRELYDHSVDPDETTNLAEQEPETVEELAGRLHAEVPRLPL
ncbi:MAG: sulfatase-like hydrolase/transferase, partial [Verrucomicrobiota bacterium]